MVFCVLDFVKGIFFYFVCYGIVVNFLLVILIMVGFLVVF